MKRTTLCLAEKDLRDLLLPMLLDQVFHVTTWKSYQDIRRTGAIKNNQAGKFPFTYSQSEVSYFRSKGCVSLFDLRSMTESRLDEELVLAKYYFLSPRFAANKPVFLLLKESCFSQLISWTQGDAELGVKAMLIPFVEAGYLNEIPVESIDRALIVTIKVPPKKRITKRRMIEINKAFREDTLMQLNPRLTFDEIAEISRPLPEDATRRALAAWDSGNAIDVTNPEAETRAALEAWREADAKKAKR